jgi:hypothetical protein
MTTREGTRVELDLGLAGSWLFLLDQDRTNGVALDLESKGVVLADGEREIYGELVAFIAQGPVVDQVLRLLPQIMEELPSTAIRLEELARTKRKPTRAERRAQREHDKDMRATRRERAERAAAAARTRIRLAEAAQADRIRRQEDIDEMHDRAASAADSTHGVPTPASTIHADTDGAPSRGADGTGDAPAPSEPATPATPAAPASEPPADAAAPTGFTGGSAAPPASTPPSSPAAPGSGSDSGEDPPPPPVGFAG